MRLWILAFLAVASTGGAAAADQAKPVLTARRGETVSIGVTDAVVGTAVQLTAQLQVTPPAIAPDPIQITANPTSTTDLSFAVPPTLTFGTWQLSVINPEGKTNSEGKTKPVALASTAAIEITPKVPKIDMVSPQVVYKGDDLHFTVIGSDYVERADEYYLQFLDAQSPVRCPEEKPQTCYNVKVSPDHQQITFAFVNYPNLLQNYAGKRRFAVSIGGKSSNPLDVTFSTVTASTPRYWAWVLLAGIILLIYLVLRAGRKSVEHEVDARTYFLSALFLDKATNTYSLSQCQFYAWTGASILGYIYLTTAKSMIQGSMAFPDIPDGLPGILLASAGTTVLAAGITSSKGNKGAGEVHPSLADFIATGGVVAAERLQFVVWTIVGVVTFVRLVLLSDPATIGGLPEIPSGFLQLMGISSAGYLGGKLVRKAGPAMEKVTGTANSSSIMTLDIKGVGLSQNATFRIGDDDIPPAQIQGDKNLPSIIQSDNTNNEPGFAKLLRLTIANPKKEWLEAGAKLTITNPDQQGAVKPIEMTAQPKIDTTPLPPAPKGAPYSHTLQATGGTGKYTWSVSPALEPLGLHLDPATGVIDGTPSTVTPPGPYRFQVKDSAKAVAIADLQIEVKQP